MTKLTDTQAILLSSASQRESGSVLPLPAGLKAGGGASKALAALLKRELVAERITKDATAVYRTEDDQLYGLFLTSAGARVIGIEPSGTAKISDAGDAAASPPAPAAKSATKGAMVVTMLSRADGATLPELIEATGWLAHTTRAVLTGLRKKGHDIARSKRDGATCYRIVEQG